MARNGKLVKLNRCVNCGLEIVTCHQRCPVSPYFGVCDVLPFYWMRDKPRIIRWLHARWFRIFRWNRVVDDFNRKEGYR